METDFSQFEKKISISFQNPLLLKEALTHRSYLNENPSWNVPHNERLEYLGDAVLELIVSEELFKLFPDRAEGDLTSIRAALVNYQMLGFLARSLELEEYLYLSRGEAKDSGKAREIILANAFEALVGAIYLDQGYGGAKMFLSEILFPQIKKVIEEKLYIDPKSLLQEIVQERMKITPTYRVLEERGPDHQKRFFVGVFFDETLAAQGDGLSKQEAELNAARIALAHFEEKK